MQTCKRNFTKDVEEGLFGGKACIARKFGITIMSSSKEKVERKICTFEKSLGRMERPGLVLGESSVLRDLNTYAVLIWVFANKESLFTNYNNFLQISS
jgi:hypothetical protein